MRLLRQICIAAIAIALLPSCTKELDNEANREGEQVIFKASRELKDSTKTSIDDKGVVYWEPNEEINVFFGTAPVKFVSTNTEKATIVPFVNAQPFFLGLKENASNITIMGLYPYDKNATCSNEYITTTLSNNQVATENDIPEGIFPAIAKTNSDNYILSFYNICGGLKFSVGQEGVKTVTISGNSGEEIAGTYKVHFDKSGKPAVSEIIDGNPEIILTSPSGLDVASTYYIVALPTVFQKGLTIRLETDDKFVEKVYKVSKEIKRSVCGNLGQVDNGLEWKYLEISYTSTDGTIVVPNDPNAFGEANIVSNTYEDGKGVIIFDRAITIVGEGAFRACNNLLSITIPKTVETIGQEAFYYCNSLKSVYMRNELKRIENSAFHICRSLESADIPSSVTHIGSNAFSETKLPSIQISKSVTEMNIPAFVRNKDVVSISVDDENTEFGDGNGSNCIINNSGVLLTGCKTTSIPSCVNTINDWAFNGIGITNLSVPNSVTQINNNAFLDCSELTTINIPKSVKFIGDIAFYGCGNLTSITIESGNLKYNDANGNNCIIETSTNKLIRGCNASILPGTVTTIGQGAFSSCTFTEISLPNSVVEIKSDAFSSCKQLETIHFPASTSSIGNYAFYGCSNLAQCYCEATVPPTIGNSIFLYTSSQLRIYVPTAYVNAYKASWSEYADKIVGYDF